MKTYCAIIWTNDPSRAGERVRVAAATLQEAKQKLEAEHGKGTVFDLHNEALRLRDFVSMSSTSAKVS